MLNFDEVINGINFKYFLENRIGIQEYDSDRFESQENYKYMLNKSVFLGVGSGNYLYFSKIAAHNTFLRYIAEKGLIGFSLLILFFIIIFNKIKILLRKKLYFLIGSFAGILVNSWFVDTLHWRHLWILLAMIIALANNKEDLFL